MIMKSTLLAHTLISVGSALAAKPYSVGPLPESAYADTEVSTNVAFTLDYARLAQLHLSLECEATATNSLEVQIGHDADADGCLSLEEADLTFGYDCGEWFVREEGQGQRSRSTVEDDILSPTLNSNSPVRRDLAIGWRDASSAWNLIRVTRRGPPAESAAVTLTVENKKFVLLLR